MPLCVQDSGARQGFKFAGILPQRSPLPVVQAGNWQEKLSNKQVVIRKEVDDVLGGSEAVRGSGMKAWSVIETATRSQQAWKDVEQCDAHCRQPSRSLVEHCRSYEPP